MFRPRLREYAFILTQYDVTTHGQRFLLNQMADEEAPSSITLVQNWPAGLKQ